MVAAPQNNLEQHYEQFWQAKKSIRVYPTEFVVRTFLANYPALHFTKPSPKDRILDVGFGDGRNTLLLCDLGLDVYGVEITQGIVDHTLHRLKQFGHAPDLRVGRNTSLPFENDFFDYVLACHSCYYCDEDESFLDNMQEYCRVMKKGGWLTASLPNRTSYIFDDAQELPDGSLRIVKDPYGNRNGYRLHAFDTTDAVKKYLGPLFANFSFGSADNDYYGINERVFWVVCEKIGR